MGAFGVLFHVAMLDTDDVLCSYLEFVARMPNTIHSAPPPVRMVAWCLYIMKAKRALNINLSPILESVYVDQVGIPFQLRTPGSSLGQEGWAFSWNGEKTNLRDLTDAVTRGFSVDWRDVRKAWEHSHVADGAQLAQLLSLCHKP